MKFLFDASGLTPHGFCLAWQPGLIWLTAGANLVIAAAYFCIPLAFVVLVLRWRAVPYKPVLGLFAAFIVSCGLSHLLFAMTLWVPLYWLSGIVDSVTAVLSVLTAIVVWPAVEKIVSAERELQAARAIAEAARLRLEELAMQDGLTGLANRRHFDAFVDIEIRRARRAGTPVALIMIDADKFKPFNDMYGHPSGDASLRLMATAIRGELRRAGDLAARFGGDEFAVVLPGVDETGAAIVAERIVQAIHHLGILHPANASGIFTASAGVAAIMPALSTFEPHHLLQLADAALYTAKGLGGNQVSSVGHVEHHHNSIFDRAADDRAPAADMPDHHWTPRMPAGLDFAGILRGIPFGVLVTDSTQADDPIVFANAGFAKMTGYSLRETIGRNSRFLHGPQTDPNTVEEVAEAIRHGVPIQREILNYRKNGQAFWNDLFMQPLTDGHGALAGFVGLQIDQTARHRAEEAQRDTEAKLAAIIDNLPGYIFQRVLSNSGVVVYSYFSQTYWRLLGLDDAPQLPDHDPYANIHPADVEKVRSAVGRSLESMSTCTVEFRAIHANGEWLWLRTQCSPRLLDGNIVWDGVGIDVTAEMASKESLAYLAYHDPLTGLCNRVLFVKTLEEMCAPTLDAPRQVANFAIDIDSFQHFNDAFGSAIGDAVLRCVADRLHEYADGNGVSARLGGDEFGIAMTDMPAGMTVADTAAQLCRRLQSPMQIGEHEISIQVCVGGAVYPFADSDLARGQEAAEELVKQSNYALADAKRGGRTPFRLYTKLMDDRERNQTLLRQSMRRGLDEQQFVLHYHPIVELATGEIIGAEALVRWAHPLLGMQRPDLFIPEAESSGLIVPLGAWVLKTAMLELQAWQSESARSLRIAVNVSAVQLLDPDFLSMVDAALAESGADPSLIELELTESVLIDTSAVGVLTELTARGCRIVVDDFGTGYASFRYLQTLPVSTVKIDQTFVRHMVIDSSDASIVRAITAVAKSLKLDVVAEGIETALQRDFLRDEGCPVGQGYLFSLPLAAEDFRWLLASRATLPLGDDYGQHIRGSAPPHRPPAAPDEGMKWAAAAI